MLTSPVQPTRVGRLPQVRAEAKRFWDSPIAPVAEFCGLLAALWCLLFSIERSFVHVRSGADAIYSAKLKLLDDGLDANLVIFGNSKVLSGFKPQVFDQVVGTHSFNLGLPDEQAFIDNLETLVSKPRAPRMVLLTVTPTAPENKASAFHYLKDDRRIIDGLFPFRRFPRDLLLFLVRSRTRGGPRAYYRLSSESVAQMQMDQGYYFIEGQSHFAGHELPQDFHLTSDQPDIVNARQSFSIEALDRLGRITCEHAVDIWVVPTYYRPGEYAPAPQENQVLAEALRKYAKFHVAGPDYWILPLDYFSDGAHLNPHGAEVYTKRLAELLAGHVK